ncbi:MAG: tyrosine-type recombinase/integrase, partial [Proteobacteria bacterium]|nr:tyrosine-type recombinase/integrase [Pseudomonadota bacterium]
DLVESTLRRVTRLSPSFVFVHSGTGQPYSAFQTWNIWTQAAKKAGVDISLYEGTRHSKVTQLIAEGHDLNLVGELVGHVTPTTTKRYLGQDATRLVRLFQGKIVDLKPDGKKS